MLPGSRECDKSHNRILLAKALRTTRFGNGAEKARKITVAKPDAMAARKKDKDENETRDDLQQNEDERGNYQPLQDEFGSSRMKPTKNRQWATAI